MLDEPTNEVCGVKNGTTFCLKPNDHENSVTTLNRFFEGCNVNPSSDTVTCEGESLYGYVYADGSVDVGEFYDGYCRASRYGSASCSSSK